MSSRVLALVLIPIGAACATQPADPTLDPTLGLSSYIEDGALVALIAGTRPTALRASESYMPVEVAIVNKGLKSLSLSRESFTLVDEGGSEYPTVGRDELSRDYGNTDVDRRLGEVGPVVRGRYQSYAQVPSTLTASFDKPLEQRLHLPRFSFAVDFLYFPVPPEGARGRRFTLFMKAPELDHPVFVKARVSGKPE